MFALTQPSVTRPPAGFPTFMALGLTVLACALESGAVTVRILAGRAGWLRAAITALVLAVVLVAGAALIGRAPGREVLFTWITAPAVIGICAVLAAGRRGSWAAVAFLTISGILVTLLGLRWIGA